MKFNKILACIIFSIISNATFAGPKVGGGGVGFIASAIPQMNSQIGDDVAELIFSNGEVVGAEDSMIGSVEEAVFLKEKGVSGFILKNGSCLSIDDVISGGSGNDPDDLISGGEGAGD